MEQKPIKAGQLASGARWELIKSRRKAPQKTSGEQIKGRHLILQFEDGRDTTDTDDTVASEMFSKAFELARKLSLEPGRFRICQNGPLVCTRLHFHLHLILPEKDEELVPIVVREG